MLPNRDTTKPEAVWDAASLRDPHGQPDKAARIAAMFDAVAPTYELVNAVGSLGRDAAWRRAAVAAADVRPTDTVVDICCGTGDMLRAFSAAPSRPRQLIGVDFAARMLQHAHVDGPPANIALIRGDALRLPLASQSADVITCAFGVRNFSNLQAGLAEMHRIARPGARAVILEFATPSRAAWRWLHRLYCERVLPSVAALISREKVGAYRYLARSIRTFETSRAMVQRLGDAGFCEVSVRALNLGGVALYRAVRPA